jgi:hypothetical protein
MFANLGRIDIELQPDAAGRRHFVQMDHRTCAEVEAEPDLSALFAIIRVLNPMRARGENEPDPIVSCSFVDLPPPFLADAIAAAGGRLVKGASISEPIAATQGPALHSVVASAMAGLVRATMTEHRVSFDATGLLAVERSLSATRISADEDAYAYWSAVLKLGSFAGELIRASNGGRWDTTGSGSLPIVLVTSFRGDEATVNPLGKAIKRFAQGEEDSVVSLVELVQGG